MTTFSEPDVAAWLGRRTIGPRDRSVAELVGAKEATGGSIAVCLPAMDEAATIGAICSVIADELVAPGLVDELVVIDSGSSDRTGEVAAASGARVHRAVDVLPEASPIASGGKGESLWKSLAVISSDIVVWLDADTRAFSPHFVTRLVAPLLDDPGLAFTKAYYERPLESGGNVAPAGGGRVTEIAVRPLINLLLPELAGFIQPLSGEYAGRTELLRSVPFSVGYDVDLLLLIDIIERRSLDVVAQVDLGTRIHRNRDVASLGRMSFEIMRGLLARLEATGRIKLGEELPQELLQFAAGAVDGGGRVFERSNLERPPMNALLS